MKQGVCEMFHIVTASSYCWNENGAGVKLGNLRLITDRKSIYWLKLL